MYYREKILVLGKEKHIWEAQTTLLREDYQEKWYLCSEMKYKQFNCSVMSDSLRPHRLQHAGPLCSMPTPRACSNSSPLSQWCQPTISSSVTLFFCPQSFPASASCPVNLLFISGGQNIEASASVPPVNIQSWFPCCVTSDKSLNLQGHLPLKPPQSLRLKILSDHQGRHQKGLQQLHTGLQQPEKGHVLGNRMAEPQGLLVRLA